MIFGASHSAFVVILYGLISRITQFTQSMSSFESISSQIDLSIVTICTSLLLVQAWCIKLSRSSYIYIYPGPT